MEGKSISHYKILSKLGEGGMGEVYLAEDQKLDRVVALKILPSEVASDPDRMRRFVQEAKAASALDHPNVAHIYEIGDTDNQSFIAMQYIEGQTLQNKVKERPLESQEIIDIATQAADALDAAASKGIVHRDIKTANIMITARGQVKILDFGLAKIDTAQENPETSRMETAPGTTPGIVLGTFQYMSPEQALGKSVDHRSDIYSLGVVLYQLATSKLPFSGNSPSEILNRILNSQPDAIARLNYNIDTELERIIRKCMEKDPERRYQTARELLIDLKNLKRDSESGSRVTTAPRVSKRFSAIPIAIVVAVIVLAAAAFFLLKLRGTSEIRSLAVLPFVNSNSDPENEWLSDGITETTINSLSQIPDLKVMARSTVDRFKALDPLETGRKLKVDAVLTGTVNTQKNDLVIAAELVNVRDGSLIWGKNYRNTFSDLTTVQRDISEKISDELRRKLTGDQKQDITKHFSVNPEAYELYLKGRFYWNLRSADGILKSIDYFNQAIAKDPSFSRAYSGLSLAYVVNSSPFPREIRYEKGLAAAKKALELDPSSAEANVALGATKELELKWHEAETLYRKGIQLDPNYPTGHQWLGETLNTLGKNAEGIVELRKALEYDPLSPIINTSLGALLYFGKRYDESIQQFRKSIELDKNLSLPRDGLVQALLRKKQYLEAINEYENLAKLQGRFDKEENGIKEVRSAFLSRGEKGFWDKKLEFDLQNGMESCYEIVCDYALLSQKEKAFEWLDRCAKENDWNLNDMKVDPRLDSIRNDPRFTNYLRLRNLI
jgi:serine/threonine-protein kinase